MANSCKFYQDGNDILMESEDGNFIIKTVGMYPTTRTGNLLTEIPCDATVEGVLQNAINAMSETVSVDFAKGVMILVKEKKEDYDGPEN